MIATTSTEAFRAPRAAEHLAAAREHERQGRLGEAAEEYAAAIEAADGRSESALLSEALRRLASIRRRRNEIDEAIRLCETSREVAAGAGNHALAAQAINGIALALLARGDIPGARARLLEALMIGGEDDELRGHIEQNLGITSNIQGDFRAALAHYQRSLDAFRGARNERGCATAYHNLGMISADRQQWDDADRYFRASLDIADASGDLRLRGLALLNRTEIFLARQRYEEARQGAEEALRRPDCDQPGNERSGI